MSFDGNNLTGTKWRFNTSISVSDSVSYIFDFYSYYAVTGEKALYGYFDANENPEIGYDGITVYSYSSWVNDAYRDIEIIRGDDVETASLITFLESNAEFLGYADVTIEYGGNIISGMFDSGAKAIRTLGKFCTSDFIVRYTAPEGGGASTSVTLILDSNCGVYYTDGDSVYHYTTGSSSYQLDCISGSLIVLRYTAIEPGIEYSYTNATLKTTVDSGNRASPRYMRLLQVD